MSHVIFDMLITFDTEDLLERPVNSMYVTEHSKNKVITQFGLLVVNEIADGMFGSNIQQTRALQKNAEAIDSVSILSL